MKKLVLSFLMAGAVMSAQNKENSIGGYKSFLSSVNEYYHYNNGNMEDPYQIHRFFYNEDYSRIIKEETKQIIDNGKDYYVRYIDTFTYDSNNRISTVERKELYEGKFIPSNKEMYEYDQDGKVSVLLDYGWDEDERAYVLGRRYDFTYNDSKHPNKPSSIKWTDGKWGVLFHDDYTYDEVGNKLSVIREIDKSRGGGFIRKKTYTYDSEGKLTNYLRYRYDERASEFIPDYKYDLTYDTNGNVTSRITYLSYDGKNWVGNYKWLNMEYDMERLKKDVYSYENKDVLIGESEGNNVIPSKNVCIGYDFYQHDSNLEEEWQYLNHTENNYDYDVIDVMATSEVGAKYQNIVLYPNPSKDYFSLKTSSTVKSVSVYDNSGKLVKTFSGNQDKYNVASLPKGIYLVSISTGDNQYSVKLLKD